MLTLNLYINLAGFSVNSAKPLRILRKNKANLKPNV